MKNSDELPKRIWEWLSILGIKVSRFYLDEKLRCHPDYPSLLSITDTLDTLGLENIAIKIDQEDFHKLSTPFLIHTVSTPYLFPGNQLITI